MISTYKKYSKISLPLNVNSTLGNPNIERPCNPL